MLAAGYSQTDLAAVRAMSEEELEAAIASDPDEAGLVFDWDNAIAVDPTCGTARRVVGVDVEVFAWFRQEGPGFQDRINEVLRDHVAKAVAGKSAAD